ncbi:MAG TPA: hypothetical protein VFJ16_19530 [Longimicrobium sp.]|nr:hypothetical protein [Longimicrobium sp.]
MTTADTAAVHPRVADLQRIMQPINSAPTLFRVNGIGPTLLGQLRYPYVEPYYIAMQFFTFVFVPLFPLGVYVVKAGEGNSYYFVGKIRYADLRAYAGPEGMRSLWLSLLRHFSVWLGLALAAFIAFSIITGG